MKTTFEIWNLKSYNDLVATGKIHPNPIGQRPPVSSGYTKSHGIVRALVMGYGIGQITLRDIRNDTEMQKVYPGYDYLVIDGGHRTRGIYDFTRNRFKLDGKYFNESNIDLESIQISLDIKECTSAESIEIFRNLNETTGVNPIEMIMSDDQSLICKEVRSRTMYIKEYDNKPHILFESTINRDGLAVASHFKSNPNPRREWDKYVFVAIHKVLGRGNVDAGEPESIELIKEEYAGKNRVNKNVLKTVDRFLDDMYNFYKTRSGYVKLNGDVFSAFQLTWFGLYGKNSEFVIEDMEQFVHKFSYAYTLLTGNSDVTYNHKNIIIDDLTVNIKEFFRQRMKNFSNGKTQKLCENIILKEMCNSSDFFNPEDFGVVFREEKRSVKLETRLEKLSIQGFVCAIDGKPLKIEDSVLGHDTPWAKGGQLKDGAVIRKSHHRDMGSITLDEYRMVLRSRGELAA